MYLSSLLACQGWYCVNSYCVFSSPFPPVCVFRYSLPFTQHLCLCKRSLQRAHTPFHLALTLMQTLSLSLGTCARANTVYNVHTHTLSLSTHACADALLFIWHSRSCKHCLQCAHTHTFTQHSRSCFHSVFVLLQMLSTVCTHSSSNSALSCKHCLQTICSMCEKPGLEPELSLSWPALRAPAQPMN